eukprot:4442697-Pyramimonas_sp.AAC.3
MGITDPVHNVAYTKRPSMNLSDPQPRANITYAFMSPRTTQCMSGNDQTRYSRRWSQTQTLTGFHTQLRDAQYKRR